MNNFLAALLILSFASLAFGTPSEVDLHSFLRHRRDTSSDAPAGLLGNSSYGKLVQQLLENLGKAGQQASEAFGQFNEGLQEEAKKFRERFRQNIEKLRARVNKAIENVSEKFSASGSAVTDCIKAHSAEADNLMNSTIAKTEECASQRYEEARELIRKLSNISVNAQESINSAQAEMRACTESGGNFWTIGTCLASLALKTEVNGAMFLTQSAMTIARVNLFMATLPAALEVCAGSSLVEGGVGTARIVMEIGSCSASSVFNNFYGTAPKPLIF